MAKISLNANINITRPSTFLGTGGSASEGRNINFRGQGSRASLKNNLVTYYDQGGGTIYMKSVPEDASNWSWSPDKEYQKSGNVTRSEGANENSPTDTSELNATLYELTKGDSGGNAISPYYPPADNKEVASADFYSSDDINPTRLAFDVKRRTGDPYVNPGRAPDQLDRHDGIDEIGPPDHGAGVLFKREFPGSTNSGTKAYRTTNIEQIKAEQEHKKFHEKTQTAMRRDNVNSTGMLNDTKPKEVIDLLASGNTDKILGYALKPSDATSDFDENAKQTHEDRYKNNPDHLSKKKLPNYSLGDKVDWYNERYTCDNNPTLNVALASEDLVPMIFHDIVNKKFIPFRSFLNNVSDTSDATWSEVAYLGRADKVMIYQGFTRTTTVDFTAAAFSVEELHPMWEKINYLVGLTKPAGYTANRPEDGSQTKMSWNSPWIDQFIIPPFVKFNLGDMYVNQPVVITNVGVSVPPEAGWELVSDKRTTTADNHYEFLNGAISRDDVLVGQYPTMAALTVSLRFLEKRLPETGNRHFGDAPSEHMSPQDRNQSFSKETGDRTRGFNYNLIHPTMTEDEQAELDKPVIHGDVTPEDHPHIEDPFEGDNMCELECTKCPPSPTRVGPDGKPHEALPQWTDQEYKRMYNEWQDCVANYIACVMGEDSAYDIRWGPKPNGHPIEINGGIVVPAVLQTAFNRNCIMDPVPEELPAPPKPPPCPPDVGKVGAKDDRGRNIGPSNDTVQARSAQKQANLETWMIDVATYIAHEFGDPLLSRDGWTIDINGPLAKMEFGGFLSMEWEDDKPFSYDGRPLKGDPLSDFTKIPGCDTSSDIRELAGVFIPDIYIDTSKDFTIKIDPIAGTGITNFNYHDVGAIKTALANWVGKTVSSPDLYTPGKVDGVWADLSGEWTETTRGGNLKNIYYAPYESEFTKMIKAHKQFPATPEYVHYSWENTTEAYGLSSNVANSYKKLKIGFYATVSKTDEKLSATSQDKWMEEELSDLLFMHFASQNTFVDNPDGSSTLEPKAFGHGPEASDSGAKDWLDPTGRSELENEVKELEELLLRNQKIMEQMADPDVPVTDYFQIGREVLGANNTTGVVPSIAERMQMKIYQKPIAQLVEMGKSRVEIESIVQWFRPEDFVCPDDDNQITYAGPWTQDPDGTIWWELSDGTQTMTDPPDMDEDGNAVGIYAGQGT